MAVRSLRYRLLRHVVLPLALTWLLGVVVALGVARYFTQRAFDRSLLDDAFAVSSHVREDRHGALILDLSATEMGTLLFDQNESLFFAIYGPDGQWLAGHPGLNVPAGELNGGVEFVEMNFQNRLVRAVVLPRKRPVPHTVVLAQTTRSQVQVFEQLLYFSVGPQLILLFFLLMALRRLIQQDLAPLVALEQQLAGRDARDLTPVPVSTQVRELQQLGASINGLLERIGQTVQAQKEFAGNVAHELRTPLSAIRALAEYGLGQSDPRVWREQLHSIVQSQERASHQIDQLLALALVQEAREVLQPQALRLDEVLRECLLRHWPRADALQVDLGGQGLDRPVVVHAQRALIEGVLDNLIDNALRYGRPVGGTDARITVELSQDLSGPVSLAVRDNGPGIDPAEREQVLSRWSQGESGESLRMGAGLGLAIVAQYARILHADLSFHAGEEGRGLEVRLTFRAEATGPTSTDSA